MCDLLHGLDFEVKFERRLCTEDLQGDMEVELCRFCLRR